jgi:hypothetical protein
VEFPGSVQWDGKYLAVTDQGADAIYRYTVSGANATLKGTVLLSGAADCAASWIARPYVYCADAGNNDGEVFKYPRWFVDRGAWGSELSTRRRFLTRSLNQNRISSTGGAQRHGSYGASLTVTPSQRAGVFSIFAGFPPAG